MVFRFLEFKLGTFTANQIIEFGMFRKDKYE
jgi:hypothetical protein